MLAFERCFRRYSYQIAGAVSQLVGIGMIYVYSNFVDVDEFSLFVVINVINGAVTVLFTLGYNPVFLKRMARSEFVKREELNRFLSFSLLSGLSAVLVSGGVLYSLWSYNLGREYIIVALLYWASTYGLTTWNFVLSAYHRFFVLAVFQLIYIGVKAILFVFLYEWSPLSLLIAHIVGVFILGLIAIWYYRDHLTLLKWIWPNIRSIWPESRFLYAESYANYLSKELDAVLVTAVAPQKFLVSFYILQRVQKVFAVMYSTFEKEDLSLALRGTIGKKRAERLWIVAGLTILGIGLVINFLPNHFNKLDPQMVPYVGLMLGGLFMSYLLYTKFRIAAFVEHGAKQRLRVTLAYLISGYLLLALLFPFFGVEVLFAFHLAASLGMAIFFRWPFYRAKGASE